MAFNAQGLLNQVLKAGQQAMRQGQERPAERGGQREFGGALGGLGKQALAGGALGLLLGNRRRRGLGGGLLRRGGTAMLGLLAYRAFKAWQTQQGAAGGEPRTLDRVSGEEADRQSLAILKAVVAAAKADGHVEERERRLIEAEIGKSEDGAELRQWLDSELRKPVDAAEVAAAADSPELAAEMYLASRLVVDSDNHMERAYLDELARALKLAPELRARLDREAEDAGQGGH